MLEKLKSFLNQQDTLEKKLFWGLSYLLTLVGIVSLIMTYAEYLADILSLTAVLMAGLCVVPPLVIMVIGKKTKAYEQCYLIMSVTVSALLLPLTFFRNGGMISGMPICCLGGIIMCCYCIRKKYRIIAFSISFSACMISFVLARLFPQLVSTIANSDFIEVDIALSFVIIAFAVILTISLLLEEYNVAIKREGLEAERKAEMRLELMNIQLENVADLKRIRHDERHHNALILQYAENGDLEGLKRYIKQKMDADEYYATKIYCMNAVINNILTVYVRKAQKENIEVTVNADVVNNLNISEPDLVSILANMFENAIHGCGENFAGPKKIDIDIHIRSGRLIMKISNTCSPKLQLVNGYPAARPGTGINSIMRAAGNYDGTLSYKLNDGILTCMVILMIPE